MITSILRCGHFDVADMSELKEKFSIMYPKLHFHSEFHATVKQFVCDA
jgi:hypothetical protein